MHLIIQGVCIDFVISTAHMLRLATFKKKSSSRQMIITFFIIDFFMLIFLLFIFMNCCDTMQQGPFLQRDGYVLDSKQLGLGTFMHGEDLKSAFKYLAHEIKIFPAMGNQYRG